MTEHNTHEAHGLNTLGFRYQSNVYDLADVNT